MKRTRVGGAREQEMQKGQKPRNGRETDWSRNQTKVKTERGLLKDGLCRKDKRKSGQGCEAKSRETQNGVEAIVGRALIAALETAFGFF